MEPRQTLKHLMIVSPSLGAGGIERALTVLADEFTRGGIRVSFVVCLPGEAHYSLADGVAVYRSGIPYAGKKDKAWFYLRLLGFLRRRAKALQLDAVLSFGDAFNPLVLLALRGTRRPVFISDRTSPDFRLHPLAQWLKKRLYPGAAGVIAQTDRAAAAQRARYGTDLNVSVIPNAIRLVEKAARPEEARRILYVGRLSWEKGVDRLLRAFHQVNGAADWRLDIVGEGPQRRELIELAETLGLNERVVFHGLVSDPAAHYLAAGVFVLPSHLEGFPNALCEAMSAGLPVVCFDSIPHESLFTNGASGVAVPKDDVAALARALTELIADPDLRKKLGTAARARGQRLRQDRVAARYRQFMEQTLERV